jgi:hypothetical protein
MAYVTARHPDLVTFEDLIAWNATDLAVRAPFGQGGARGAGTDICPADRGRSG